MSEELKNLIDSIEKRNQTDAQLEKKIKLLREEIKRLRFTIKEQRLIIQDQEERLRNKDNVPDDIQILKDLVLAQRKELKNKDKTIEELNGKIIKLKEKFGHIKDFKENKDSELSEAKTRIEELSIQNKNYMDKLNSLQNELKEKGRDLEENDLAKEFKDAEEKISQLTKRNKDLSENHKLLQKRVNNLQEELVNKKRKARRLGNLENQVLNLEEENSRLINQIMNFKKEISYKNKRNEKQAENIEQLEKNIKTLKNCYLKMENKFKSNVLSVENGYGKRKTEKNSEFSSLNEKIEILEQENEKLNKILYQLKQQEMDKRDPSFKFVFDNNLTKNNQTISILDEMFHIMGDHNRDIIVEFLIDNLEDSNLSDKRSIIKILGRIRSKNVFKTLLNLTNDENWLVRYDCLSALERYIGYDDLREKLKTLLQDEDVDVREKAGEVLSKIEQIS
jgi:chromosome segregation ATPase